MHTPSRNNQGFGTVGILVAIVVLVMASSGGWYAYNRNRTSDTKKSASAKLRADEKKADTSETDPYEGWKSYTNATYGISFKYPAEWKVDEGSPNSPDSATKQEHAINLKRNEEVKYNNTVSIEILGESLEDAIAWYDNDLTQSSLNHVTRRTNLLKGKESIQYIVTNSDEESKLYLLSMDGKTFLYSSINEAGNAQADREYWNKFDKVFESLQID